MKTSAILRIVSACAAAATLLAAAPACAAKPAAAVTRQVVVASDPQGASITIDGVPQGAAPLTLQLAPGGHLVETSMKGYETDFRTLVVGDMAGGETIRLKPATAAVLVQSEPAGAVITRDGVNLGFTPMLMPEVPFGAYRVELSLAGYKPQQIELVVAAASPQKIATRLVSSSAALDITSDPPGAAVSVNGVPRGQTPVTVDKIEEGQSSLEILAQGYEPFRQQLSLSAGEVFKLHAPLVAIPSKLAIVTIPEGARVYVENQYKGDSPLNLDGLPAGSYRIRVEKPSFEPMARTIELGRNTEVVEEFKLSANVGSLRFTSSPAGVTVFVNGREFGTTEARTNATDQISEPLEVGGLPVGEQELVFTRKGHAETRRKIVVNRGETTVVDLVRLERLFIPDVEVQTRTAAYRGVYVSKNDEFYRVETKPGLTMSIPNKDIVTVRLIREENVVQDNVSTNQTGAAGF